MVFDANLGSFDATVRYDYWGIFSILKVHQTVRWKGLYKTGNEHGPVDEYGIASQGSCYRQILEVSR